MAAPTSSRYDLAALRELAASAGLSGSDVAVAAGVAMAESGGDPGAISSTGDYGLWQINARSWPQFDKARLLDPGYNARAMAVVKATGRGWNHWTTYRNGNYRRHLEGSTSSTAAGIQMPSIDDLNIAGIPESLNPVGIAGDWVDRLVSDTGRLALALLLSSAGLALAGIGLSRLVSTDSTVKAALGAAGGAGTVASLVT